MHEYINQKFGKLLVLTDPIKIKTKKRYNSYTICLCDCGNIIRRNICDLNKNSSCKKCYLLEFPIGSSVYNWTIINHIDATQIICKCKCGHISKLYIGNIRKGQSTKCVICAGKESRLNLLGKTFGNWKIISYAGVDKYQHTLWKCECNCKNKTKRIVKARSLISGHSKSCGCIPKKLPKGSHHPHWNSLLTDEERNFRVNDTRDEVWARKIKQRDKRICQKCQKHSGRMCAHHIFSYTIYPEKRYDPTNGITLCEHCHKLFHHIYGMKGFSPEDTTNFLNSV